tara:strand:- start:78 stop:392 length:315 start_codon:yes stop_codon:yes gene_type:complete
MRVCRENDCLKLGVGDLLIDNITGNRGLLQRRYLTNPDAAKRNSIWAWEIHWFRKSMNNMILNVHTVSPKPQVVGFRHYAESEIINSIIAGDMSLHKVIYNANI